MSTPDSHLVRKAFLTKYGYPPDLTYSEILCEFHRRYDHAQALRHDWPITLGAGIPATCFLACRSIGTGSRTVRCPVDVP